MKQQNLKTHRRLVFGHHFISFFGIVALLIGSIINYNNSADKNLYSASLLILVAFILLLMWFYLRAFSLKAQDRAIKAEEKLRYFILTGKAMSEKITIRQIIGLRFASDEEFPDLVEKAEKENLSENDIKKSIKTWKADNYRV